tara:strand:- start:5415 stop:6314 length:900 start_codon:yes stop_codon:yes gene_type:complete
MEIEKLNNKKKPFVSYHVHTFNRLESLKVMLKSFFDYNKYENFEWVIVDLGSTDGTQEFLWNKYKNCKDISIVLGNRKKHEEILKSKNMQPRSKRQSSVTIFGWAKNIARSIARGDYFIEIADDHKFISETDWVTDMLDVFEHRAKINNGICDISSIIYRGLPKQRLFKANNKTGPEQKTSSGVSYFLCESKGYDDYHMMKKSTYEKIGPYLEIEKEKNPGRLKDWESGVFSFCQYTDYVDRCNHLGYKKAFLKVPVAVDCEYLNGEKLFKNQVTTKCLKQKFKSLTRPISTEEIDSFN